MNYRSHGPAETGSDGVSIEEYCQGDPSRDELTFMSFDSATGDGMALMNNADRTEEPPAAYPLREMNEGDELEQTFIDESAEDDG